MTFEQQYALASIPAYRLPAARKVVETLVAFQAAYKLVSRQAAVPWWCIGALHSLEAGFNFRCHLHNGDPLSARTVRVPVGRPVAPPATGILPYTWIESAVDALSTAWRPVGKVWNVTTSLAFMERYNGLGYREMGVPSPYLWSFTDQYTSGLFTRDGKYDPLRTSASVGAAAIFKLLEVRGSLLSTTL